VTRGKAPVNPNVSCVVITGYARIVAGLFRGFLARKDIDGFVTLSVRDGMTGNRSVADGFPHAITTIGCLPGGAG
jgi:hypothetical protein